MQPFIPLNLFRNDILIPIPPIREQNRITSEIERWFSVIDELESNEDDLLKTIDKAKSKILDLAIHGKLVPQDPNDEPASALMNCIREEKKRLVKEGKLKKKDLEETPINEDEIPFDIPESWEWVRLGYISTYASTKKKINAAEADPNLWGLDLEDIEKGGRLLCIKSVGERKAIGEKTCFSEGDILYSKLRPYLLKILIAPKDGICTPEIIPFNCYGSICKDYIVCLLKSSYVDDYINSVTFGVKMPRVSTDTLVSLIIPLPPLAEQKRIAEKIEKAFKAIDELS
jgi:type I restriction enzyme S subunit